MCSPSSGAGGAATGAEGPAGGLPADGEAPSSGAGGGAACTVKKRASGAAGGHGRGSALDPHFDIAALQFELGDVFLN